MPEIKIVVHQDDLGSLSRLLHSAGFKDFEIIHSPVVVERRGLEDNIVINITQQRLDEKYSRMGLLQNSIREVVPGEKNIRVTKKSIAFDVEKDDGGHTIYRSYVSEERIRNIRNEPGELLFFATDRVFSHT